MVDILDVLQARCAEIAGDAILSGETQPGLELTTHEVEDLINHIAELHRRHHELELSHRELDRRHARLLHVADETALSLERIRATLTQRTAHPEAQLQQASTIARCAAQNLGAATPKTDQSVTD